MVTLVGSAVVSFDRFWNDEPGRDPSPPPSPLRRGEGEFVAATGRFEAFGRGRSMERNESNSFWSRPSAKTWPPALIHEVIGEALVASLRPAFGPTINT